MKTTFYILLAFALGVLCTLSYEEQMDSMIGARPLAHNQVLRLEVRIKPRCTTWENSGRHYILWFPDREIANKAVAEMLKPYAVDPPEDSP